MSSDDTDEPGFEDPFGDDDEDIDRFLEEWREVDRRAASILREALPDIFDRPAPEPEAVTSSARLREGIEAGTGRYPYFVAACGWQEGLPDSDAELWRRAAAATISPPDDPGTRPEEQSAVFALEHADWLGMVVGLVRRGVGARCTAVDAVRDIRESPEVEGESDDPDEEEAALESTLLTVIPLWQLLGLLDEDERLTTLGQWGLPHALHDAWEGFEQA